MFNLKSKLELKAKSGFDIITRYVWSGYTGACKALDLLSEVGDLLNQGASNAFPPFHCWNPCLTEQSHNPTAIPELLPFPFQREVPFPVVQVSGQFSSQEQICYHSI